MNSEYVLFHQPKARHDRPRPMTRDNRVKRYGTAPDPATRAEAADCAPSRTLCDGLFRDPL